MGKSRCARINSRAHRKRLPNGDSRHAKGGGHQTSMGPVAGIIVAVAIAGRHPVRAATGRIRVVAVDPDPAAPNQFVVRLDPNCAAGGPGPRLNDYGGRRRRGRAELDADVNCRGFTCSGKGHDHGGNRCQGQTKRSDFHNGGLDSCRAAPLQTFCLDYRYETGWKSGYLTLSFCRQSPDDLPSPARSNASAARDMACGVIFGSSNRRASVAKLRAASA